MGLNDLFNHCLKDPNQLVDVQVFKDTEGKKYQQSIARKASTGKGIRRPSSQANKVINTSVARVSDKGGDAQRLEALETSEGKRILLGAITNIVREEEATPNGPPPSQ